MSNTKEYKILYFYFSFACLNFVFPTLPVLAKPQVVAVGTVGEEGDTADTCQDLRQECAELAEEGGCEGNAEFMEVFCQRTCDTCRPRSKVSGCEDQREECGFWGGSGQCDFNPAFMNINCPATCRACSPLTPEDCVDQHRYCFLGSLLGLCRTNPSFYLVFCGDSCRRFIPICRAGRSSTVPELCLSRVRGEGIQCGKKPNITSTARKNRSPVRKRRDVVVGHQPQGKDSCSTPSHNSAGREAFTLFLSEYEAGVQDERDPKMEVQSMTYDEENQDVFWKDSEILRGKKRKTKLLRIKRQEVVLNGDAVDYEFDPTGENINGDNVTYGNHTETNFCIMPLIGTNTSVNICAVIIPLMPIIAIGITNAVFTALSASSVAQQTPSSRPPMNQPPQQQPNTPSQQQPTPQQPSLSIDVKVRALVPFCTASGYLSLEQRLRRLIRGNTGRPLNPIAASLAVSVNFCQYGVGRRNLRVPDPPQQLQQPSVAQVFLTDYEANAALNTPHRWPGISFPGLNLYQGDQTPPPPVSLDAPTGITLNDTQTEGEEPGPRPVTEDNVNNREAFSCGGALISPYHVVTAAHCLLEPGVTDNGTVNFLKPSVVRLGEVDFTRADESQAFDYEVDGVQVHEGYALPAKYNDIAIITLKYPVQFTEALQPYCLPRVGVDLVGRSLTVSGWGVRPGGQVATILHNIEVREVSEEECRDAYDDEDISAFFEVQYPNGVNKLLVCATSEEPVCRGDSGGPLVLDAEQIQYEVGVVSTGYGCGASQYPGIYTNVSQFLTWIREEVYDGCSVLT